MAEFRSKGRIFDHNPRQVRDLDEKVLWTIFSQRGSKYNDLLQKLKPDMASEIIKEDDAQAHLSNSKEDVEQRDAQMNTWYEEELKDVDEVDDEDDEPEKSEYEKMRDRNIEELELAKKASGLFDD